MNQTVPDANIRQNSNDIWNYIKNDIDARLAKNPDVVREVSAMSKENFDAFKNELFAKYTDNPNFSVIVEPERETPLQWDSFTSSYVGGEIPAKTRKLRSPEIERIWTAYGEFSKDESQRNPDIAKNAVPLEKLSDEQRKELSEIAEESDSPLLPYLKFDKRYIEAYDAAKDYFYKSARNMQADQ